MGRLERYEGMIPVIFTAIFIAIVGVASGWFFSIITTLGLSFIGTLFIVCWFWEMRHGGGSGDGELGMIFLIIPGLAIFVISSAIVGLIFHLDDLLYLFRSGLK